MNINFDNIIPLSHVRYRGEELSVLIKKMSTVAFMLTVDGRAYIEDMEGGLNQPQYLKVLKWRLFELLAELDFLLTENEVFDTLHYGALSLEYGLKEIARLSSNEILEAFQFQEEFEKQNVNLENVLMLWGEIINRFPGDLPEAMLQVGQAEILMALKDWSRICTRANVDTEYLKKLLNDV